MPEKILQEDRLDKQLLDEGFVVVPFLNAEETKQLIGFFNKHHPQGINGFYATSHSPDIPFRNRMNDEIKKTFKRAIDGYFNKCIPLGGSFVVKSNTQKERLHPHQDWNIVDEEKYRSFSIWVPLVDLNDKNGVIKVLPGSHRWVKNYRGPNIPDFFQSVHEQIWKRMTPLYMHAGEALIYDHRLFHASDPNTTDELRIATVFGIIPEKAEMFYYRGNEEQVEVYESSADFFLKEDAQEGHLKLRKVGANQIPGVSIPEFLQLQETNNTKGAKENGLFNFFRRLF